MFQGGGNIPLILPIVRELAARGHRVRVLAGPGIRDSRLPVSDQLRERIAAAGAAFVRLPEPAVHPFDAAPTSARSPREAAGGPPAEGAYLAGRARVLRWAPAWAAAVAQELAREPA